MQALKIIKVVNFELQSLVPKTVSTGKIITDPQLLKWGRGTWLYFHFSLVLSSLILAIYYLYSYKNYSDRCNIIMKSGTKTYGGKFKKIQSIYFTFKLYRFSLRAEWVSKYKCIFILLSGICQDVLYVPFWTHEMFIRNVWC